MRQVDLSAPEGTRWLPDDPTGVGALVLAGSSGRVDSARAEVLARYGVLAESIRWFGGHQQHDGPWEIPLELFFSRIEKLAETCDRVLVVGTSFGAEAALLVGAMHSGVDAVIAFSPSDVVWAGSRPDGSVTSHWTLDGLPLPYVPFADDWEPHADPPAYVGLYAASRERFPDRVVEATIPVERIRRLVLVAGGDDQVWPSLTMSTAIQARRLAHHCSTTLVSTPDAGHRAILPGEPVINGGINMRRGGSEAADRRLGEAALAAIRKML